VSGRRVLIFGGTGEARELAALLLRQGYDVITSLAGVTAEPLLPEGKLVRGGFGGAPGIAAFAKREGIAAIVDATHPFAARISAHAHDAARERGIPYLRLERPAWVAAEGDNWLMVSGIAEGVAAIPSQARVMLTIGRKAASAFLARRDLGGVARMIERPDGPMPDGWTLVLERPPFTPEREMALFDAHRVTVLVCKNSGGDQTRAKLVAAREKHVPVIMLARPAKPAAMTFADARQLSAALDGLLDT
jgi:precorrin-6A/cobalt-precorrin-6A reductase